MTVEVSPLFWGWISISVTTSIFGAMSWQGRSCSTCSPHLHSPAAAEVGTKILASFGVSVGTGENQVRETARSELGKLQDPEKSGEAAECVSSPVPGLLPSPSTSQHLQKVQRTSQ